MKVKKSIILLIIPLFLMQPLMVTSYTSNNDQVIDPKVISQALPDDDPEPVFEINSAGGEDNLKSNVFPDGIFTEVSADGGPTNFQYGGSGYVEVNPAYQTDVYSGSYAYLVSAKGTEQFDERATSGNGYASIPNLAYIDQGITLDFKYKANNPDIAQGGEMYLIVRFYNGSSYWLYYYLSTGSAVSGNSSSTHHINLNSTIGSWNSFNQNITQDYLEAFGKPGASNIFYYLTFYVDSPSAPTGAAELILDEIRLYNKTNYQYITDNWDFEDGTGNYWSYYYTGPSYCYVTNDDSTEGDNSLNLTSSAYYESSQSYLYAEYNSVIQWTNPPKSYYAENPGDLVIEFDWKYNDVSNGGSYQNAMFYVISQSETHYYYNFYILGNGGDTNTYSNYTAGSFTYRHFLAESFGIRDTWNRFSLDVYDLFQQESISGASVTYVGFETVNLLVDDFIEKTYPTGDPSFEFDYGWTSTNPLPSWVNTGSDLYTNITTDAHTGNYAANLTIDAAGSALAYRPTNLEVDTNLYTDFWWKLNDMSDAGTSYAMYYLQLNDFYYIYYVLGAASGF
ncbi:MAG: hypothetical protein ACTSSH_13445, partial [Candidatus Heimdallarchaeota archaeon]